MGIDALYRPGTDANISVANHDLPARGKLSSLRGSGCTRGPECPVFGLEEWLALATCTRGGIPWPTATAHSGGHATVAGNWLRNSASLFLGPPSLYWPSLSIRACLTIFPQLSSA